MSLVCPSRPQTGTDTCMKRLLDMRYAQNSGCHCRTSCHEQRKSSGVLAARRALAAKGSSSYPDFGLHALGHWNLGCRQARRRLIRLSY